MKLKSKLLTLCLSALLLISMCVVSFAADSTTELLRWTFDSVPEGTSGAAGTVADGVLSLPKGASGIYRMPFGDTLASGQYYELNFDVKADEDRGGIGTRFYDYNDIYMNYGTFSPGAGFCFRKATYNGSQISAAEVDVAAPELNHWYTVKVEWNTAADKLYTRYTVVDTESGDVLGSVEYDLFPDWYGKLSTPKAEPKNLHIDTIVANTQVDNVVLYQHAQKPGAPEVTPGGSGGNTPGETPASPDIIANETFDGETALNKNWAPHGSYTVANDVMTFGDNVSSWPTLKFKGVNTTDVYELSYDIKATEDVHKTTGLDRFLMYGVNNSQSFGAYIPGIGFGFNTLAFSCQIPATAIDVWYTVKCEWSMNPENTYATYSVYVTDTGAPLGEKTGDKIWTNAGNVPMSNFMAPTSVYVWNDCLTGCQIDNIRIRKVTEEEAVPALRITADNVPLLDVNNIANSTQLSANINTEEENGVLVMAAYTDEELTGVAFCNTPTGTVYEATAEGKDGFTGADTVKAFFFDKRADEFKPLIPAKEIGTGKALSESASFDAKAPVLSNVKVAAVSSGGAPNVVNVGGRNGWKVSASSPTASNISVNLADNYVCGLDSAQTAHVEVDYYDGELGGFSLFYMGKDGEYKSKYVQLHNTGVWKTATFDLYDASFGNDCYNVDFILMTNDVSYTSPKKYYMHTSYYDVIFGGFRVEL
ncbi:MAG: hypothetical protein IJO50_02945, partial [Clostridia bacterium]|nr:hypothetical protein [Clostridia bacterium]